MKLQKLALVSVVVALLAAGAAVLLCSLGSAHREAWTVRCRGQVQFLAYALERYKDETGYLPHHLSEDAQQTFWVLFEGIGDAEHGGYSCPAAKREGPHDTGFEMAVHDAEAWRRLSQADFGWVPHYEGWPIVWCRGAPHKGLSHVVTMAGSGLFTFWRSLPADQLRQINRVAEAILGAPDLSPDLEGAGFFEWGFQKRVAQANRKGLANLKKARRNSVGLVMVPIPGGRFGMGITKDVADQLRSESGVIDEYLRDRMPQHDVELRPFWVSIRPVRGESWELYQAVPKDLLRGIPYPRQVSWQQARVFCEWLTTRERASGAIEANEVYRLPTEAEWEWMARGGGAGPYPHGQEYPKEGEPFVDPYSLINGYGVVASCDREWCLDRYDPSFYGRAPLRSPVCLEPAPAARARDRVVRGCALGECWTKSGKPPYVTMRNSQREDDVGPAFRVVLAKEAQ